MRCELCPDCGVELSLPLPCTRLELTINSFVWSQVHTSREVSSQCWIRISNEDHTPEISQLGDKSLFWFSQLDHNCDE